MGRGRHRWPASLSPTPPPRRQPAANDLRMIMTVINHVQKNLTQGQIIWRQSLAATVPRLAAQALLSAMMKDDPAQALISAPNVSLSALSHRDEIKEAAPLRIFHFNQP